MSSGLNVLIFEARISKWIHLELKRKTKGVSSI